MSPPVLTPTGWFVFLAATGVVVGLVLMLGEHHGSTVTAVYAAPTIVRAR